MVSSISSSSNLMAALATQLPQKSTTTAAANKIVFSKLDVNSDGKVSSDELAAVAAQNGTVSSGSSEKAANVIRQADTDGDNVLNAEELASFLSQLTAGGLNGSNNVQLASARDDFITVEDLDDESIIISFDEVNADDDDEDDLTVSQILSQLIDSLSSTDETDTENSTTETASGIQQKLFNFFDQDSDGTVSDAELNNGVVALKTAMANYMLSVQESRAAA